jgi:hypothetical protein
MPAVSPVFFHCFPENLAEKLHNFGTDTFKWILTNTAPNHATNTVKSNITQIVSGNGYTTDGNSSTAASSSQTGGVYSFVINNPSPWIGTGAGMAQFRYAVLYNFTSATLALVCSFDYGSPVTVAAGEIFAIDASSAVFTINLPA